MFRRRNLLIAKSTLFNQDNFYKAFERDMLCAQKEVIIESPFITARRLNSLLPTLKRLTRKGVCVVVNTKPIEEQEESYRIQSQECIGQLLELGVKVLLTGGHHRKIAIIDRSILYEGSLNILSQNNSCEVMRRISSPIFAEEMLNFLKISNLIN